MEGAGNMFLLVVLMALICHNYGAPMRRSRAAAIPEEEPTTARENKLQDEFKEIPTTTEASITSRRNKALNLFGFYPSFLSSGGLDFTEDNDDDINFTVNDENFEEEDLSRTIPTRRRQQNKKKNSNGDYQTNDLNSLQYENSPIFYIRLPPTPYMFVPGLGYVSQPPTLGPPMSPMMAGVPPQVADPFINLPIDFVSNGKPTGVYQWSGAPAYQQVPQMPQVDPFGYGGQSMMPPSRPSYNMPSYSQSKPKPAPSNSKITNLKGQYVFNGKPSDSVYVLRDSYNSIYSDALQNFYP
ncbi:unnamed protein product [Arctia plantaginis]|uniref:Uncharacterized protein n=1 Tax=Arctia plantaginis TaxID=874455 RepID=A0A8S0YY03_ARCPL|nr:unnamed protein product [Arctia plantaginis]CAB3229855.1 unnamed protein product [Arctia plantaginis]